MNTIDFIEEKISRNQVIILDGATGTELEKRGVAMNSTAWSAEAVLTSPEIVQAVHEDYIRAGADIITCNSFSLAKHMLIRAGLAEHFPRANVDAINLAIKARENIGRYPVAIAGSIAPTTFCSGAQKCFPPSSTALSWYGEQAEILAGSGADLLIIEMIEDVDQGSLAVEAALTTGLPVWLGFSCRKNLNGEVMLWGQRHSLAEGIDTIARIGGDAALIMHTETREAAEAFAILRSRYQGRLGVYAHSGVFIMPNWQFSDIISPEAYASEAGNWVKMSAEIIGGCCGIGPAHIRLLKKVL
jgi:S-methylmethionine-dependent homocysteine/selenocysteine methylase